MEDRTEKNKNGKSLNQKKKAIALNSGENKWRNNNRKLFKG